MARKKRHKNRGRSWARIALIALLAVTALIFLLNLTMILATRSAVYQEISQLPEHDVALVLGTSRKLVGGNPNPYFEGRIRTAVQLYQSGKVKHILVSGDNRTRYYNEPQDMFNALVALGIPEDAITLDYAGLRTLDSVVRCKEIFGQDKYTIVTQQFHSYRALFISDFYGMEAVAFPAPDVAFPFSLKVLLREFLARPNTYLDLYIFRSTPKHLGEKEEIQVD